MNIKRRIIMDATNQQKLNKTLNNTHVMEATSDLMNDGKKLANELYDVGVGAVETVQNEAMEYTDELLQTVRKNPLKSILIAAGVGFLLSVFITK